MKNNRYKDLPIEIRRRYTPEELDDSFIAFITRINIRSHCYYNSEKARLRAFSNIIINGLLSNSFLNVTFSHDRDKNAVLYDIFYNGLLEFYKDKIADHYNQYEKYNVF